MPPSWPVYAELLAKRLVEHKADCWLVNTGWSGGPYGVGSRMKIEVTRALLDAVLEGSLADVRMDPDPYFGFLVPSAAPGVDERVLHPRQTWGDPDAYDRQARKLAGMFQKNFEQFRDTAPPEVAAAGPCPDGPAANAAVARR